MSKAVFPPAKVDKEKFSKNFDDIDWGDLKDKPIEARKNPKKHATAGICGEFGMSTFDEKAYKENFDNIDWSGVAPSRMATKEELEQLKDNDENQTGETSTGTSGN